MSFLTEIRKDRWPTSKPKVVGHMHGWLAKGTQQMLTKHLSDDTKLVLELGAWLGKSTKHILLAAPNAHVLSVDLWDEALIRPWIQSRHPKLLPIVDRGVKKTYMVNLWEYQDRLTPLQMHSHKAIAEVARLNGRPDVVYLDTSHGYRDTLEEVTRITEAFPLAVIVGDDWEWALARSPKHVGEDWGCPVARAVTKYIEDHPEWSIELAGNGWAMTNFIRLLPAQGPTKVGHIHLHPSSRIGGVVFQSGTYYEPDLLSVISRAKRKGVYIDVGAHVGNHTTYFALECPATRVIAIEPDERAFKRLRITVEANDGAPVTLIQAAVHNQWRTASIRRRGRTIEGGIVPVVHIDNLLDQGEKLAVIKVDVEGVEDAVLRSGLGLIKRDLPLIAAEALTDSAMTTLEALLRPLGYIQTGRYSGKMLVWEPRA